MRINLKTIILILLLFVPIFLLCWINPPVTLWGTLIFIVYVVAVIGWYFYTSLKRNNRFYADFRKPNDQQYALVQEYVKEVKRDIEKAKFFKNYWLLFCAGITGLYLFIRLSMEGMSGVDLVIGVVFGISFIVFYFLGNMLSCSSAVARVNYNDFEIARVEYIFSKPDRTGITQTH